MAFGLFVTGTDTGVGKTLVSSALLRVFAHQGRRVVGMKPVAAGAVERDGRVIYEDVEALLAASTVQTPRELVNPYHFTAPIAPHIAAQQEGVTIEFEAIRCAYDALAAQADVVIVEGAGGFKVPLGLNEDFADLARALGLPVVLVVGMRLGCINHALLTQQAIAHAGLELKAWVANRIDPHMQVFERNLESLVQRIDAPLIGVIPHLAQPDAAAQAAQRLDVSLLGTIKESLENPRPAR